MREQLLREFRGCNLWETNIDVGIQLERQEKGIYSYIKRDMLKDHSW